MRSLKHNFGLFLLVFLLLTSCADDFLETEPLTEFSEVALWDDPSLAQTFINNIYANVPDPADRGRFSSNIVDEADYRGNTSSWNFNNGVITQDGNNRWFDIFRHRRWGDFYSNIRSCNTFLENVEKIPFDITLIDGKTLKDRMIGEVHFLRAYTYHEMVCMWGGVPLVEKVYGLADDFAAPRDTYEDCINFIVAECDLAAGLLPDDQSGANIGRATKGAALALKSRVLLYAASDLHNTNVIPGYSNPELLGYIGGDRTARWTAAKNAAKDLIDLQMYSLYMANPAPGDSAAQNISDYFLTKSLTQEDIWVKFFVTQSGSMTGLYSSPNGYHGWGVNAPVGDLVDDYEMDDGTRFDWNNPAHAAEPYKNRDQRFYATIFYEGAKWRTRSSDVIGLDPLGVLQAGKWEIWDDDLQDTVILWGIDTRQGPIEDWNGSYTGYYMRKHIDPTIEAQYVRQSIPYRFFRYAEILLNYAEACIELSEDAEARTYLNMVRTRAGQPDVIESGDALRTRYRNERRIELAFEEHRIHDVRRWAIGPDAYHPMLRANITYKLLPDHTTATVPTITHDVFQIRSWDDKAYFMPILRGEMNKNSQLIQNPDY